MKSKEIKKKHVRTSEILRKMNDISLFLSFGTLGPFSTRICHKVQISSKVTNLNSFL